jgi:hypothetical protein
MQFTRETLEGMLANVSATSGPFDPANLVVGLWQTKSGEITADSTLDQFGRANYQTYSELIISTWSAPVRGRGGMVMIMSNELEFRPFNSAVPNTIQGALLIDNTNSASQVLRGADQFAQTKALTGPDTALVIVIVVAFDEKGNYGVNVIVNP